MSSSTFLLPNHAISLPGVYSEQYFSTFGSLLSLLPYDHRCVSSVSQLHKQSFLSHRSSEKPLTLHSLSLYQRPSLHPMEDPAYETWKSVPVCSHLQKT